MSNPGPAALSRFGMNKALLGVIFTLLFVLLESAQFVFFGGLFQKLNSFLYGFLVFGLIVVTFVGWAIVFRPGEVRAALANHRELLAVNVGAVITFSAYLGSVQLVEPAITYTISSGAMPVTAYLLYRFGIREGEPMRNRLEAAGNVLLFFSIVFLALITVVGLSGFVRGGFPAALGGVCLAVIDGVFFTFILVYSQRLNRAGVGPSTVLGIRLPLYVLVTGALAVGVTAAPSDLSTGEIALYVTVGFALTVPPLYLLQRAVPLVPTLTISSITALGPLFIFALQMLESRVDFSAATLIGLAAYTVGALLAATGAVRASAGDR